jgi:hypothetical protein
MDSSHHSWLLGQSHPIDRTHLDSYRVEVEYRSVSRSLSRWGPKGEPNAPIAAESEMMNLLRLLKLIWQPDLSMLAIGVVPEYRSVTRSLSGWGPKGEPNAPIAAESEMMDLLRLLKLIWQPDLSMLAIRVEPEYRSITRSLSGWGLKGEPNALITDESEMMDLLRLLKLIWQPDLSMLAIGVESEYRSVTRSLSGWGPKGESNAPITAESEVMDLLRLLKLIWQPDLNMLAIGVDPEYRSVTRSLSGWGPKGELNAPIAAESEVTDFLRLLKLI